MKEDDLACEVKINSSSSYISENEQKYIQEVFDLDGARH